MQRLNQLFKQMSRLVIEQGSLLDRIDVNMDSAMKGVRLGKKELDKAMHT
jgi:syntaxin 16